MGFPQLTDMHEVKLVLIMFFCSTCFSYWRAEEGVDVKSLEPRFLKAAAQGKSRGQCVLTFSMPVGGHTPPVRPPCWVAPKLLQLELVSEEPLLPLLGGIAGSGASAVVIGGDDTAEQQEAGSHGTEDPEEGGHWWLMVIVLVMGLGARGVVVVGKLCIIEHCSLLFTTGRTRLLEQPCQRLSTEPVEPVNHARICTVAVLGIVMNSASWTTFTVHLNGLQPRRL